MEWIFKSFDELTNEELYAVLKLRFEVFVIEQNCLDIDPDGKDKVTTKAFNALQMINIILRFIMTYGLIAQEEDRRKLYFHSVLMLVFFVLTAIAYS